MSERTDTKTLADAIQERRHVAELATSRAARDSEWDLEAYWRARAEGLAEAEKIVRERVSS